VHEASESKSRARAENEGSIGAQEARGREWNSCEKGIEGVLVPFQAVEANHGNSEESALMATDTRGVYGQFVGTARGGMGRGEVKKGRVGRFEG